MRDVPDPAPDPAPSPRPGARSRATALRRDLAQRNAERAVAHPHEQTRSSVVYAPVGAGHGNFIEGSYRRILADPEWAARLEKAHTAKRQARPTGPDERTRAWRELDTATSSDALLMNIFCYPRVLAGPRLPALLGVDPGLRPVFGYRPRTPRERGLEDRTEVDMRLGSLLVEAKLTEVDFQSAPLRLLERYPDFLEVFDPELLPRGRGGVLSYQLLRGVLAAHHEGCRFAVFLDARRPDLVEAFAAVLRTVRPYALRARLRLVTWQEIACTLPGKLQVFLEEKYGIPG